MIPSGQASVVVQGPIVADGTTAACLRSIRAVLPQAQIILSTWKGSATAGLDYDLLIESDDPGGFALPNGVQYNLARQITSTLAGLRAATQPYALKLRTDCLLQSDGFLRGWDEFPRRAQSFSIFDHRLIASDHFFCDTGKPDGYNLFHISDIVLFGLTTDLKKMWDVPAPSSARDIEIISRVPFRERYERHAFRYIPEQWIWLHCLQQHGAQVDLDYHWQFSRKLASISETSILNNFRVLSLENFGVKLSPRLSKLFPDWMLQQADWEKLYEVYCGESSTPEAINQRLDHLVRLRRQRSAGWLRYQIRHYWIRLTSKFKSPAK